MGKTGLEGIRNGCMVIVVLIGIIVISIMTCNRKKPEEPVVPLTKKEIHYQNVQKLFSDWDGSHIVLTEKIKESLNDPNGYEHLETKYIDRDTLIIVNTTFTAKNAFGGTLKKNVIVVSDTLGNIKEIVKWFD